MRGGYSGRGNSLEPHQKGLAPSSVLPCGIWITVECTNWVLTKAPCVGTLQWHPVRPTSFLRVVQRIERQIADLKVGGSIPLAQANFPYNPPVIDTGKRFDLIYADPPWPYYGDPNKMGAAGKEYSLMTLDELAALPVARLAANPSVLFMWTTSVHLLSAARLMDAWGFVYRGVGYVWVKTTDDGKVISGQGVRPSFTKPTSEFLLIGSTLARGRPFPLASESQPQVVLHPRLEHSEKPEIFRELIEGLFEGEHSRIELFARRRTPGWELFGNEVPDHMEYQQPLWGTTISGPNS